MRHLVLGVALLMICSTVGGQTTYYVRTDGGDAGQCTGTADAAYPGSGSDLACAWNHPFQALPPMGPPRIAGGDTLLIKAGSYRMGYGAPGDDECEAEGAFECHMTPVPSGPDASHPTRILGEGWDVGCSSPPELWGSERPWYVLNLTDSSHVEVRCLELTDHSVCIEDHNQDNLPCTGCRVPCERNTPPFGDWAAVGLYAEDSHNVYLADLSIHGLAVAGVHAGRLRDWTVERVRIVANGWAGWDGDIGGSSSSSGDLVFRRLEVAWNGCAETWPGDQVRLDTCWGQQSGGYGDGIGLAATDGRWVLEDCHVHHNTSDGADLLYLSSSASAEVLRLVAEGNAGNQLKTSGDAHVENSLLVSDCSYFEGQSPLMTEGDHCRAGGAAYLPKLYASSTLTVVNSTITGEGDCLIVTECQDSSCDGSESVQVRNVLFAGHVDWYQPWENTCLYWYDPAMAQDPLDIDYSLVWQVKDDLCPGANSVCSQNPMLENESLVSFDGHLREGSPAIDAGTPTGAPNHDLDGLLRVGIPDIGAYEHGGASMFPDLVVTDPGVTNANPGPGESFTIRATVRNQGTASSSSSTLRYLRSDNSTIDTSDTEISSASAPALASGGSSSESATVSIPTAGTYWVGACVDAVSGESNTNNNCSSGVQVTVNGGSGPCVADSRTMCLNGGRFEVKVDWVTQTGAGSGQVAYLAGDRLEGPDSGIFYFFTPDNWELMIKVLDGCAINDFYWVFAAASTNVEYTITVRDTLAHESEQYLNPLGNAAAAINDTSAFATCP